MVKVILCRFGELVDSTTAATAAEINSVCVTVHISHGVTPILSSATSSIFYHTVIILYRVNSRNFLTIQYPMR